MDISKTINNKLDFGSAAYLRISRKLGEIDRFNGSWQKIENKQGQYLKELRKIAMIKSIGSSTRIEGAQLSDEEVEKLLKSVKIIQLTTRDEQEVVGYYDALEVVLDNHQDIELKERFVHQLHGMLLKHSDKDQAHKGKYKGLSNQVVANYPDGAQKLIFRTTEPHLTPEEMRDLYQWINRKDIQQEMHPVLLTAIFVYEFLSIHPYQDGNGRLSRLLTTLILLQNGYDFIQYVSFEHEIENNKEAYYRALMDGQKNRYEERERIDQWIDYFLDSLISLTQKLEAKYAQYNKLKTVLNDRQQSVMGFMQQERTAQIKHLEKALEAYSRNTLKKDLAYLVSEGFLLKTGAGRGVQYHINEQ